MRKKFNKALPLHELETLVNAVQMVYWKEVFEKLDFAALKDKQVWFTDERRGYPNRFIFPERRQRRSSISTGLSGGLYLGKTQRVEVRAKRLLNYCLPLFPLCAQVGNSLNVLMGESACSAKVESLQVHRQATRGPSLMDKLLEKVTQGMRMHQTPSPTSLNLGATDEEW